MDSDKEDKRVYDAWVEQIEEIEAEVYGAFDAETRK